MTAIRAVCLLLLASAAAAQDRPSEGDLFGKPAEQEKPAPSPSAAQPAPGESPKPEPPAAEPGAEARLLRSLGRTEDPLKIGGLLYLRSVLSAREHTPPSQWPLVVPTVTDVYLDVRPSDRVRGFVLGRMLFDPTLTSATVLVPGATRPPNPEVLLDQLWINFDVERTAFVTLGRQNVKWGVGHFWNPTDYLHAVRRDPLAVFDERTGTTMARVNVPWEARGWNFSPVAVFEPLVTQPTTTFLSSQVEPGGGGTTTAQPATPSNQLAAVGVGGRAEILLGTWELGLDGVAQRGIRPRFGIDLSGGIWELDVRGELALRTSSDVPLYRGTLASFARYEPTGIRPMVVGGADWSHKYSDQDTFTIGVEYFYNSNGYSYDERSLYPVLIVNNAFTPFYLGRHYAGAYLRLPKPGSWNRHDFTFSVLANLSDRSAVTRLDWSMNLLTYLVVEGHLQGHLGTNGGEFRLGVDIPPTATTPAVFLGAPIVDVGLAVRVNL